MANFLGFSNEEIENNRKEQIKQEIIKKWEDSGLLDGLEYMNRTDLSQLYGGEAISFNTSSCSNMSQMFTNCTNFNTSQLISEIQTESGFEPKNKIKKHKL